MPKVEKGQEMNCPCDTCEYEHPGCVCAKALEWFRKEKKATKRNQNKRKRKK